MFRSETNQSQSGSELEPHLFEEKARRRYITHIPSMDSPLVNRIFRRLFAHDTCSRLRTSRQLPPHRARILPQYQRRTLFGVSKDPEKKYGAKPGDQRAWQQRVELSVEGRTEEFKMYPMVTADTLRTRKTRPRRVKMLLRDFIEGSHYASIVEMDHNR